MRDASEVASVLELHEQGLCASAIARRTGVPRGTVRWWIDGRLRRWPPDASPQVCPALHVPVGLPREYAYLLGLYLGDGCLSGHPRGVYKLRINLDLRYPGIIDECERAIRAVTPRNRVNRLPRRSNYTDSDRVTHVEVTCYSKNWPAFLPQHGPGRKHERSIELAEWQRDLVQRDPELLLRGLIHSDGCRAINTGAGGWRCPRYSFSNRSADIRQIFTWTCDLLGLHWTTAPDTVYVSRKADVARMDTFIGPKA